MVTAAVLLLAAWGSALAVPDAKEGNAGEVISVRGLMSAVHPDGSIEVLGAGNRLRSGDTLVTGEHGYGTIGLWDGSRMTLRPGTRFALENCTSEAPKPFIGVRLLRGGIRAVSGWVAKQAKGESFQLATPTAMMHIRGTEFDARLCEGDCSGATAEGQATVRPQAATIARVVQVQGHLAAIEPDGRARGMNAGSVVFQNDRLETGVDSFAVVAFQDGSRITLQADTVFFRRKLRLPQRRARLDPNLLFAFNPGRHADAHRSHRQESSGSLSGRHPHRCGRSAGDRFRYQPVPGALPVVLRSTGSDGGGACFCSKAR